MKNIIYASFTLLLAALSPPSEAASKLIPVGFESGNAQILPTGFENGNAGDAFGAEFILSARDVVQRLELLSENGKPVFDTAALRAAIKTTKVVSEDKVYLDGKERDAVNYPAKRLIKISRTRWKDYRRSTETKTRLRIVLHEYLPVAGTPDDNYVVSERLIELINPNNYSPNTWWNPVNPANTVIPSLAFAPEGCRFQEGKFDLKNTDEVVELETQGECGESYRKLRIVKSAGITPVSSKVRGQFHKYEISVYDRNSKKRGEMWFEPAWGECLMPENGSCRVSGKMAVGGVETVFWYLRD